MIDSWLFSSTIKNANGKEVIFGDSELLKLAAAGRCDPSRGN